MTDDPTPAPRTGERIAWLDGLRGLAACQVVLLHYVTACLPGLGMVNPALMRHAWEYIVAASPLFVLLNGYDAVYLFFLMSGVALTCSFSRENLAMAGWAARRLVRLGVPMAASVLLGYALISAFPLAHVEAAAVTGSQPWLGALSPREPAIRMALHQIVLDGMILGTTPESLAPAWLVSALGLRRYATAESFNVPLWTLHLEFASSLLVIGLVAARAGLPRRRHLALSLALTAALANSPLCLFALGHLAAPAILRDRPWPFRRAVGGALLALGLVLCAGQPWQPIRWLDAHLPGPLIGPRMDAMRLQALLAVILVFAGLAMLPVARGWLARPAARWMGRLSFSLYLVHFPVLFTLVSTLFLAIHERVPYWLALAVCGVAGVTVSVVLAMIFERWIDRPAIRLSRRVGGSAAVARSLPVAVP